MITVEKKQRLYEGVISGKELTTKELSSYDFNSKDLTELISQGVIKRVKRGFYEYLDTESLFFYGKGLLRKKQTDKAGECFDVCYQLNPEHGSTNFQLFYRSISNMDYDEAFKYFDIIIKSENSYYEKDAIFYLYLLSMIIEVPEKYREFVKRIKYDDIKIDVTDKRYQDVTEQNKVRLAVMQRKFPFAIKLLNTLGEKSNSLNIRSSLTKKLLFQAVNVEKTNKKELIALLKDKKYDEMKELIQQKAKRNCLSIYDTNLLKLLYTILNIMKTGKVPTCGTNNTDQLFDAIDGQNYSLALKLSEEYNSSTKVNGEENLIHLLLVDINTLIKEIQSVEQIKQIKTHEPVEIIEDKAEDVITSDVVKMPIVTFADIVSLLMCHDIEGALKAISSYLINLGKFEYEFLIVALVKLSLLENDFAFTKPMVALTHISRNQFVFDPSSFVQDFYLAISNNNFDQAKLYLDIIANSRKLNREFMLADTLTNVLNHAQSMVNTKIAKKDDDSKSTNVENIGENSAKENKATVEMLHTEVSDMSVSEGKTVSVEDDKEDPELLYIETKGRNKTYTAEYYTDLDFIKSKYEVLLRRHGAYLLKPMTAERRNRIHEVVKEFPDMVSFNIGAENETQIVLRYKPQNSEFVNISQLVKIGDQAYKAEDYDKCVEAYTKILQVGKKTKAFAYAKLGLAYLKKSRLSTAVDYFIIATKLSAVEKTNFDFSELIDKLTGVQEPEDNKPYFRMRQSDFKNDTNDYYGITNVDDLFGYISESGLDVESACLALNMPKEQIDIIKLIYAREYYCQGDYDKGDEFLKSYEKSKNKSPFTISIHDEIRRNKKFYINRERDNVRRLALTIKA